MGEGQVVLPLEVERPLAEVEITRRAAPLGPPCGVAVRGRVTQDIGVDAVRGQTGSPSANVRSSVAVLGHEGVATPRRGETAGATIVPDGNMGQTLAATVRAEADETGRPILPVDARRKVPRASHLVVIVTGPLDPPATSVVPITDGQQVDGPSGDAAGHGAPVAMDRSARLACGSPIRSGFRAPRRAVDDGAKRAGA